MATNALLHPATPRLDLPLTGEAFCHSHHGELIQGAIRLPGGGQAPCLVSLPRLDRGSACRLALFRSDALEVVPAWKGKALRAARLTLARFGLPHATGRLLLDCALGAGLGLGSSTADVVAAIRAVAAALGTRLSPGEIAAIAVAAETACDPVMFEAPALLFAPRQGRVLEDWGRWFPDYIVLGCTLRPGTAGIDTLSLPPDASDTMLDRFERIVAAARQGFRRRDLAAIAAAATESARLNQRRVRLEWFEPLRRIAAEAGALGVQIAHSGVVGGVLLDPHDPGLERKIDALAAAWRRLGGGEFALFRTGR